MNSKRLIPVGKPLLSKPEGNQVSLIHVKFLRPIKINNGFVQTIPKTDQFKANQYLKEVPQNHEMTVTDVEWEYILKAYEFSENDVEVKIVC